VHIRCAASWAAWPDRLRVSMDDQHEVRYWTKTLGCSKDELTAAVARVGNSSDAVRRSSQTLGIWDIPTRRS
jgi:uncharacterized protein DUF3606